MEKQEVFFIVPAMYSGGQERVVSRLTYMLRDIYDIKVILFSDAIIDYPLYCDYISLDLPSQKDRNAIMRSIFVILRVFKLRQLVKEHKPWAALSFGGGANIVNVIASNGKWKSIISVRGYASVLRLQGWKNFGRRLLFGKADKIICVSQVMLQEIAKIIPKVKNRLCLLYNAYDIEEIRGSACESTGMDELFSQNDVIITVGTLDPIKGYLHLIKAVSLLKKKRDNLVLVHIGPDYYNYGQAVKDLVRDLGLEDHVLFLGYQENPYKFIGKSRIFVLSSISEGFPNALVEAMACGIPVISTDCKTGPREILSASFDGEPAQDTVFADYGVLVPPFINEDNGDPNVVEPGQRILAQAIERLLDDKILWDKYADKARQRASFFTYEKCKEKIVEIING